MSGDKWPDTSEDMPHNGEGNELLQLLDENCEAIKELRSMSHSEEVLISFNSNNMRCYRNFKGDISLLYYPDLTKAANGSRTSPPNYLRESSRSHTSTSYLKGLR